MVLSNKERNVSAICLGAIAIFFTSLSWLDGYPVLAVFFLFMLGGLALVFLKASDKDLEKVMHWMRWFS